MNGMGLANALRELIAAPEPERDYTGFPAWYALLVEPNREEKSAHRLARLHAHPYLPQFRKQVWCRGKVHVHRLTAVIPGMLFVPIETIRDLWGDDLCAYAHVRGCLHRGDGFPAELTKADIEIIREMEAKLNLPPQCQAATVRLGQVVRFLNDLYAAFWGKGTVVELANANRVGVEVANLFGRAVKVYVPASEIEAL